MAARISAGGPPTKMTSGRPFAPLLGDVVVEAAAFLDLPVYAEGLGIVALDAIHAEVVMAGIGVLGIDQRQGDEVPAVLRPGFEQG